MGRKLSKSKEEFFANEAWSANKFFEHAKKLIPKLEKSGIKLDYGRTVIYIEGRKKIKAYVHYKGLKDDTLTFTDEKGNVMKNFNCNANVNDIEEFLIKELA